MNEEGKTMQHLLRPKLFLRWAFEMFGDVAHSRQDRVHRFIEEAIELAHAERVSEQSLNKIQARVYSRPRGETDKEIGQSQATLECFAESIGLSSDGEAQREWERVQEIPREEWQRRHSDWNGRPRASRKSRLYRAGGSVYFIRYGEMIKIGFTLNVAKRVVGLQSGFPSALELVHSIPGTPLDEMYLHKKFSSLKERGEWFRAEPVLLGYIESLKRNTNPRV